MVGLEVGNGEARETANLLWKYLPSAIQSVQEQMLQANPESPFRQTSNHGVSPPLAGTLSLPEVIRPAGADTPESVGEPDEQTLAQAGSSGPPGIGPLQRIRRWTPFPSVHLLQFKSLVGQLRPDRLRRAPVRGRPSGRPYGLVWAARPTTRSQIGRSASGRRRDAAQKIARAPQSGISASFQQALALLSLSVGRVSCPPVA